MSKMIDKTYDKYRELISDIYEDECGCQTTRIFLPEYSHSTELCKPHNDARVNRKPYSKYVHHRGLCPYCHGYDELARQGVCICGTYERRQELDTIRVALKEGMTLKQLEAEDAELLDEVQRVRERRGKEQ